MSLPIIVFYHCALNYGDREWARTLIAEQMNTVVTSGLAESARELFIGVNGTGQDAIGLSTMLFKTLGTKTTIIPNPPELWPSGEVGTMRMMHEWLQGCGPCHVLYFHTKGLSFPPGHGLHDHRVGWRQNMEAVVLHRWKECVAHLEAGAESVGQWWNVAFNGQYWAGNFFWATSEFLLTLPYLEIVDQNESGRYEAEVWIGRGPRLPKIVSL